MNVLDVIAKAKGEGRGVLNEAESKEVLRAYGIPVVDELIIETVQETMAYADSFGFPACLKALGSHLTHKTERNLVRLGLKSPEEVFLAAKSLAAAAGSDLEGFLLQPMVRGRRELVAGMFCDPQFGPAIMLGLGGIFTEALRDVAFRVAPVGEGQAAAMMDELRGRPLLGPFRGEEACRRDHLLACLTGLSRLALEQEDIVEVDINPLIIGPDGAVTAVDALVVLGERPRRPRQLPAVAPKDLARIFHPRSLAFVGASGRPGKWGHLLLTAVLTGGFEGPVYLVNPKGGTIAGRPVHRSLEEIEEPVDLGIVTVPAAQVFDLIPQFRRKGIRYMLLVTSGFSETGAEGRLLEERLAREAAEAGILVLGPNTMGIMNPHARFYCTGTPVWPQAGPVGLVAQSGNLGTQLLTFAESEGIGIRAFSGSGNEAMITIEDYMRALEEDDLTKTVLLYVESIKDGRRFLEAARNISLKKPVVLLKGGRTDVGNRAAASHTGAMASNMAVFNAACRQAGVVMANQPTELLDLSVAFSFLPLPKGDRVGIVTLGGGWGVVAADLCAESGLKVPSLPPELVSEIDTLLPPFWSRSNPVDVVGQFDPSIPLKVVEALVRWDGCDAILHLGAVGRLYFLSNMARAVRTADPGLDPTLIEASLEVERQGEREFYRQACALMEKYGKPIIGVCLVKDDQTKQINDVPGSPYKGVSFSTPERAVVALAKMVSYSRWLAAEQGKA